MSERFPDGDEGEDEIRVEDLDDALINDLLKVHKRTKNVNYLPLLDTPVSPLRINRQRQLVMPSGKVMPNRHAQ